jgi:5'-nucleotidase / UDP-sugar diphosphatase
MEMNMNSRLLFGIILSLIFMLFSLTAYAEKLQILHTNDLHGFLESTVIDKKRGGYHNIKRIFEEQTLKASNNNIKTLRFDGGDFSEGSIFYLTQKGRRNFELMNLLNYDAVVLGNHDWLMGTKELTQILKDVPPQYSLLAANLKSDSPIFPTLSKTIEKYKVLNVGDLKVAVIGLITDEKFYEWRFDRCKIKDPVKTAKKLAKKLKREKGIDFVFILSHIGVLKDKEVLEENSYIDLIVGGHSHTELHKPYYIKDKSGRLRPIVQTGEHGKYVGKLVLDLKKNEPLRIESYELLPVLNNEKNDTVATSSSEAAALEVKEYVKQSRELLNAKYSENWLKEVLGTTQIPLVSSYEQITVWTALITDGLRECVNADFSAHSPGFGGADIPIGEITREDVFQAHPRIFNLDDKFGWHLYEVEIRGIWLKTIIKLILNRQMPVSFSGVSFDIVNSNNEVLPVEYGDVIEGNAEDKPKFFDKFLGINTEFKIKNIKIKSKKIKWNKKYKMALPEGIILGGVGITKFVKVILKNISKTENTVWECINKKIQREKVITTKYQQSHDKSSFSKIKFISTRISPEPKIYNIKALKSVNTGL